MMGLPSLGAEDHPVDVLPGRAGWENTRGPYPLVKRDRLRFLSALDTAVPAAPREAARS
jgi:hypothetical protein